SQAIKRPVRVTGAYRVPVTITPKVGDARLDIGQFERKIEVSIPKVEAKYVTLRGAVRGGVWLTSGAAIELGTFKTGAGRTEVVELVTDRPGVELGVVEGQQRPDFTQVSVDKKEDLGGKR